MTRNEETLEAEVEENGVFVHKHDDYEVRDWNKFPDPFELYPDEELYKKPTKAIVVEQYKALKLVANRPTTNSEGKPVEAGIEWLHFGPCSYIPRVEVKEVELVSPVIIMQNQALVVSAKKDCIDQKNNKRIAGEKWLVKDVGNYLMGVDEQIEKTLNAYILTDKDALHLKATKTFTDVYNKKRKAGNEWLVTLDDSETHIIDVHEEVVNKLKKTTLNKKQ